MFSQAKEWLCLNCQTQRALKGMESSGQPIMKSPKQPHKSDQMDSTLGSVARQQAPSPATQPASQKKETSSTEAKQPPTPKPFQQQTEKHNPAPPVSKPAPKTEPQQEQGFFGFGFGGARSRSPSPSPQPAVSAVSGKVLGFGSSFLSSASNLISSAVEDESIKQSTSQNTLKTTTTPQTSRKGSTTSQGAATTTTTEKANPSSQKDKTEQTAGQKSNALLSQAKKTEPSSQMPNSDKGTKPLPKSCPLCKVEIKKDNYNTCTECKNTVCNLCGFNPTPHQTEVNFISIRFFISYSKKGLFDYLLHYVNI